MTCADVLHINNVTLGDHALVDSFQTCSRLELPFHICQYGKFFVGPAWESESWPRSGLEALSQDQRKFRIDVLMVQETLRRPDEDKSAKATKLGNVQGVWQNGQPTASRAGWRKFVVPA